jgi:hypothetical protein
MCSDIDTALAEITPFIATTAGLQYFPDTTISVGFAAGSQNKLLQLHRALLYVAKRYRNQAIEPEFSPYLSSRDQHEAPYTTEYGEPFVMDLYTPTSPSLPA